LFRPVTWSGSPAKWLWFTAVFELVLAGVFAVLGFMIPVAAGGMYLTAAILGVTGILLLLWARKWQRGYAEAQRIKATGVPGSARIVGMRQTGVYMNEQPQVELTLEVTTSMQGPYQVVLKEYIPMMLLGTLTSGAPLPVKADPANPNNVIIEWESAGSMAMGGAPMGMGAAPTVPPASADSSQMDPALRQAEKERLLASGIAGKATVLSSRATGETDSEGRPVYDLMLRIEIPGQQPMQGPSRTGVPPERVDRLETGDTVTIKSDPANPTSMTIDWNA
jgi:hypothetical protein